MVQIADKTAKNLVDRVTDKALDPNADITKGDLKAGKSLVEEATREQKKGTNQADNFLGGPEPKASATQAQDNALNQAPDRALRDLQNVLREPNADRKDIQKAITGVLQSGPDGLQKVQDLLTDLYSKGGGAHLETTAKALRDSVEKLGMSERDFQDLTSKIAYNATTKYIETEMAQTGRLEIDTNHIKTIQGTLRFEWSGELKNYKQIDQAVTAAVKDKIYDIVNEPDKGGFENRSAYKLASEFRLGREVLKPDQRLQQEQKVNEIIFNERAPGEKPEDKVAALRDLQKDMKLSDGDMRKLIESQVEKHLESQQNKDALKNLDAGKAKELLADLNAVKDSFYWRAEKLFTNIGDAQTILETNIEASLRRPGPSQEQPVAPANVPAGVAAEPAITNQPPQPQVVASDPQAEQAAKLQAEQAAKVQAEQAAKIAELEKQLKDAQEAQKAAEAAKQAAEQAREAAQKAEAERQAKVEAERKATERAKLQDNVGNMMADPNITPEEKVARLTALEKEHGLTREQMEAEVIGPAIKAKGAEFLKELDLEQSKKLQENLELLEEQYSKTGDIAGLGALQRALDKQVDSLEKAQEKDINQRVQRLANAMDGMGTDEAEVFSALSGLDKASAEKLKERYQELRGESLEERLKGELGEDDLKLATSHLSGDKTQAAAATLNWAMSGPDHDEELVVQVFTKATPGDRAAIIAAYEEMYKTSPWSRMEYSMDKEAIDALKALPGIRKNEEE
jgi:colicin import membrane protein